MFKRSIAMMLVLCMMAPMALDAHAAQMGHAHVHTTEQADATKTVAKQTVVQQSAPVAAQPDSNNKFDAVTHDAKAALKKTQTDSVEPMWTNNPRLIRNEYIEFYVAGAYESDSGRFTIGNVAGNPNDPADDGRILLFGHSSPWSSYTTIQVNGENYIFHASETTYDAETLTAVSTMTIGQIVVQQTLRIVENSVTALADTVQISYSVQNNSSSVQLVGVRIMMDTMLGSNDGAPFKVPTIGNVTQELELVGNEIPTFWQATDSLTNPSVFSLGTFYKGGELRPDKVQFAAWGDIYDSNHAWNYTVDNDKYVTGDSAVAIYWNPKAVNADGTLDVTTYYGVGYAGTSAAEATTQVPVNGFAILVVDEDSQPVAGATVRVNDLEGMPEVVTNEEGLAVFDRLPSGNGNTRTVSVNVSKEGYLAMDNVSRTVTKGGYAAVSIYPDDGTIHILAVNGSIDGTSVDLLSKNKYFNADTNSAGAAEDGSNVKYFTIQIEAASTAKISKFQLMQGGDVVLESTSNTFKIPVYTGTPADPDSYGTDMRITSLCAGKTVYLRVVDENNQASKRIKLGIKVSEPKVYGFDDTKGSLNFGEKLKINVPSGIPILGDTEIELGWNGLPFEFEISGDGKVKFAINVDMAKYEAGVVDGTSTHNWDEISKDYKEAMEQVALGRSSAAKAFGGKPQKFTAGCVDFKFDIMGYGEGYVDKFGDLHVKVGLVLKVKQSASYTWTFFLGYVPVYVSVGEQLELSGSGQINIMAADGKLQVSGAVGEINPKLTLNVDGGVGANGVLSIGASGRVTLSWLNRWTDGYNKVTLTGGMYIVAQAFLFKAEKKIAEGTWTIYDSYRSITQALRDDGFSLYDSDCYVPVDRNYLQVIKPMYVQGSVVQGYVYPDASPTMVKVGDTAYLFWLSDVASRAANDRTALVYAKSTDMETWSNPVQIIPENFASTAEYAYSVLVDGTNIHIAISKANCKFQDQEVTIDDLAAASEMYYVCLDTLTDTASDAVRLTDNDYADILPAIAVVQGQVVVAYAENMLENGLFGTDNTYQICYSVIGGETRTFLVDGLVTDLAAGRLGEGCAVAYTVDEDRDFNTGSDVTLHLLCDGEQMQVANSGSENCSLTFATMGEQSVLLWYAEDGVRYLCASDGEVNLLQTKNGASPVAKAFYAINDAQGNLKLVWEYTAEEDAASTTMYAVHWDGTGWSNAYVLAEANSELTSSMSGFTDGEVTYIAHLKTWGVDYDQQYSTLCLEKIYPESDADLVNVAYDTDALTPGQVLPLTLTIRNNGAKQIDTIVVMVDDEEICVIENAGLDCGDTKSYTVSGYFVDADLTDIQNITVSVLEENDTHSENNAYMTSIGYADVQVDYHHIIVNQQDWLSITVTNASGVPTNTIVRVFADEENGAVLYERYISGLTNVYAESILLNLSELDATNSMAAYYIVAETAYNETVVFNNTAMVYMENCREQTYSLMVSAGYGGALAGISGGAYAAGDAVVISAVPDKGYVFAGWTTSAGGSFEDSSLATTVFIMPDNNVEITAVFTELEHTHVFTDYHSNNDATCVQEGTKTAECDLCRAKNTIVDEGTKTDHTFSWGYCEVCGMDYALYVHEPERVLIDAEQYPESKHDYENNTYERQVLTCEGAYALELTFSDETAFESGCDEITLYDGNGNWFYEFTGTEAAGITVTIPGDTVYVELDTDSSVTRYGYSFTSIVAVYIEHTCGEYTSDGNATCEQDGTKSAQCTVCYKYVTVVDEGSRLEHEISDGYCIYCGLNYVLYVHELQYMLIDAALYPESEHDYAENAEDLQVFTWEGAYSLELTFSEDTQLESGYDFITLYDADGNWLYEYTDTEAAGRTITIPGDTVRILLTSDGSECYYGYSFASIRAACIEHTYGEYISDGNATCAADGTKTAECTLCYKRHTTVDEGSRLEHAFVDGYCAGCGLDYALYVHEVQYTLIDASLYPESEHDYADYAQDWQMFTWEGAYFLELTFSEDTAFEFGCDHIAIYDGDGNWLYEFSGTSAAGQTITVPGDTVRILLVSDGSVSEYGYSFTSIRAAYIEHTYGEYTSDGNATCTADGTKTAECTLCYKRHTVADEGTQLPHTFSNRRCTGCGLDYAMYIHGWEYVLIDAALYPESTHNYQNNVDDIQTFIWEGAYYLELTFSEDTKTERGWDIISLYDGDDNLLYSFTGTDAAGVTVVVHGDTVKVHLTTDESVADYGYAFDTIYAKVVTHNLVTDAGVGATCTQDGLSEGEHCTECGEVTWPQEVIPATGHSYGADDVCTVCGAVRVYTITAGDWKMDLDSVIYLNYYPTVTGFDEDFDYAANGGYILWTGEEAPSSRNVMYPGAENCVVIENCWYQNDNGQWYVRSPEIYAKNLGDMIYIRPYVIVKERYIYGACWYYSAAWFCYDKLSSATEREDDRYVCAALLAYGAAAQTYFGYATDEMVTDIPAAADRAKPANLEKWSVINLGDYDLDYDESYIDEMYLDDHIRSLAGTLSGTRKGIGLQTEGEYAPTLDLQGAIRLSIYCTVDANVVDWSNVASADMLFWNEDDMRALSALTAENASYVFALSAEGDVYKAQSDYILAKNLSKTVYYSVRIVMNNGNVYRSGLGYYSPEQFVADSVAGESGAAEVCKAIAVYSEMARIRFKVSEGFDYSINYDGTSCTITGMGSCKDRYVVIPEMIDGYIVTAIGDYAFEYCANVISITLPDGITSIGTQVFVGCTGLESMTIPASVVSIGDTILANCYSLDSICVSENNPVYHSAGNCLIETDSKILIAGCNSSVIPVDGSVETIGSCAFYGCVALAEITIPASVTHIDRMAFANCKALNSITVSSGNPEYHSAGNCLIHTDSRTLIAGCNSSVIPADGSVESIEVYAFYGRVELTEIVIPASVVSIGTGAFAGCEALSSITVSRDNPVYHSAGNCVIHTNGQFLTVGCKNSVIPDDGSVTSIGSQAFYLCNGLESITIPGSVTTIGYRAFYGCAGLTALTIMEGVESIEAEAFAFCDGLTEIYIPASVSYISGLAFLQDSLARFCVSEDNAFYHVAGNCLIETESRVLVFGSKDSVIPDDGSVTSIGDYAFFGCDDLISIFIPVSVTWFGMQSLSYCENLAYIYYEGTQAQWEEIGKNNYWDYGSENYTVICLGEQT